MAVDLDHKCYILTEQEKEERNKQKWKVKFHGYIFFDYEAYQDKDGNHVPNLIIARKICANCLDSKDRCQSCLEIHKFYNNNDFCEWLLNNDHHIALAHNLKGYDGTFIVRGHSHPYAGFTPFLFPGERVEVVKK